MAPVASAFILLIPLIVSGIIHMIVVKVDLLSFLKIPINNSLFGSNKTWRGFVIMPVAAIPGVWIAKLVEPVFPAGWLKFSMLDLDSVPVGLLLGIGYLISELPNSYMKRRLGIMPGMLPDSQMSHLMTHKTRDHKGKRLFFLIHDQIDSALGCVLVYYLFLKPGIDVIVAFIFLGLLVHFLINFLLFLFGIRKRPV